MADTWLQVAQEALKVPGLLVEIYGDAARPGVQQAGKALGTIIGLGNTILWPIAWANERSRIALESNLNKYREKLQEIPQERIVEVAPELGVPIAEKLTYVRDPLLTELYVTLLSKASIVDYLDQAHPSFVNIINNFSPDEARLMECFVSVHEVAFVSVHAASDDKNTHKVVAETVVSDEILAKLAFPQNSQAYFSNLAGLGLIEIRDDFWFADESMYKALDESQKARFSALFEIEAFKGQRLDIVHGIIKLTPFGRKFIQGCHAS